MPEESSKQTASTTKPTVAQAQEHLAKLQAYYETFGGKKGYNPFFYIHDTLAPLKAALVTPPVSDTVIAKALALKQDELNAKAPVTLHPVGQIDLVSGFKHLNNKQ